MSIRRRRIGGQIINLEDFEGNYVFLTYNDEFVRDNQGRFIVLDDNNIITDEDGVIITDEDGIIILGE